MVHTSGARWEHTRHLLRPAFNPLRPRIRRHPSLLGTCEDSQAAGRPRAAREGAGRGRGRAGGGAPHAVPGGLQGQRGCRRGARRCLTWSQCPSLAESCGRTLFIRLGGNLGEPCVQLAYLNTNSVRTAGQRIDLEQCKEQFNLAGQGEGRHKTQHTVQLTNTVAETPPSCFLLGM